MKKGSLIAILFICLVVPHFFAAYLSDPLLDILSVASRTIFIDDFKVERLYFIDVFTLREHPVIMNYLFQEMSYILKSRGVHDDNGLLGFFVFRTIDPDFFQTVPGNFGVFLNGVRVKGTLKNAYKKYASLTKEGVRASLGQQITSITHYLGQGIETFPVFSKAIDSEKGYQVVLKWWLVAPEEGTYKVKNLEDFVVEVPSISEHLHKESLRCSDPIEFIKSKNKYSLAILKKALEIVSQGEAEDSEYDCMVQDFTKRYIFFDDSLPYPDIGWYTLYTALKESLLDAIKRIYKLGIEKSVDEFLENALLVEKPEYFSTKIPEDVWQKMPETLKKKIQEVGKVIYFDGLSNRYELTLIKISDCWYAEAIYYDGNSYNSYPASISISLPSFTK